MLLNQFLVLGAALFAFGVYGLLIRRNVVLILLSVELMLNAVNINLIAFESYLVSTQAIGQVFAIFVITVAAAEVGIGLAIVLLGKWNEKWGHRLAIAMMGYVFLHGTWLWILTMTEGVLYEASYAIGVPSIALRRAAIVPPTERRDRSTIWGDHGNPIRRWCSGARVPPSTARR